MINNNPDKIEKMVNVSFESLIFPDKIVPPCFFNSEISENLKNIYDRYSENEIFHDNFEWNDTDNRIKEFYGYKDISTRVKKGVEPIIFIAEKPSTGARKFSVAHPLVQIPLHKYILENVEALLSKQLDEKDNYCSNSRYFFKNGELYVEYDYNGNETISSGIDTLLQKTYRDAIIKKHILSKGKYYRLYLDISNFYHNIYTHTISWGISSEEKNIFDNLDIMMRTQNNNETKGIIIGPYSSGLFAEILMSKIDKTIIDYINSNNLDVSYVRYVDDIEIYSDDELILNNCLFILENELMKYKLDINHNKTAITEFPFLQIISKNTKSIFQLRERLLNYVYDDELEKIEDIISEINNSIKVGMSNAKYLLNVIKNMVKNNNILSDITDANILNILLDYLLNIAFKYPYLIENCSLIILSILKTNKIVDVEGFLLKIIGKRNTKKKIAKEIIDIWLVYIIASFNFSSNNVDEYFCEIIYKSDICVIMILDYYYRLDKLIAKKDVIKEYLDYIKNDLKAKYDSNWKSASWLSKYWLLFYMNDLKWKIHEYSGYHDCLLNEVTILELIKIVPLNTRLNIFDIMLDLRINFLDFSKE